VGQRFLDQEARGIVFGYGKEIKRPVRNGGLSPGGGGIQKNLGVRGELGERSRKGEKRD